MSRSVYAGSSAFATSLQLIVQKGAREAPVAVDRTPGHCKHTGDLLKVESGKIAQVNHSRRARIAEFKLLQRCVERERLLGTVDGQMLVAAGQRDALPVATGTLAQP